MGAGVHRKVGQRGLLPVAPHAYNPPACFALPSACILLLFMIKKNNNFVGVSV